MASKSMLLTGAEGSRVGAILTLQVGKGDKVSAKVFAKYESTVGSTNAVVTPLSSVLIGALTGQAELITEFGATSINNSFTTAEGGIIGTSAFGPDDPDGVMAFLNVLFISDEGITTIDASRFAFDQILGGEQVVGSQTNTPHDSLAVNNFTAPSNGIVIIYVSNENPVLRNVYFDDLQVTINEHPIVQADDYYPFGLTFNSYQRVSAKQNDYLYNGKELQDELDLNWLDYGARMYDPAIGRWTRVDNQSERGFNISPYNYTFNNPIKYIDPDGNWPWESKGVRAARKFARATGGKFIKIPKKSRDDFGGAAALVNIHGTTEYYNVRSRYRSQEGKQGDLSYDEVEDLSFVEFQPGEDYSYLFDTSTKYAGTGASTTAIILEAVIVSGMLPPGIIGMDGKIDIEALTTLQIGKTKDNRKINKKRQDKWKEKEQELREGLRDAKTKKEKEEIKKQIKHAQNQQKKSESHGRKHKGS